MFKDSISAREAQTSSFLNALNALAVKRDGK